MKNILTLSDFDENNNLVEPNSGIVLFFAEWCGHCKKLLPTFEKIDEASKDVSVFAVNCSDSKDEDVKTLMKNFDIKGYPTIFWFVDGKNMGKYEGGRREEDILKFAKENGMAGKKNNVVGKKNMRIVMHLFFIFLILSLCSLIIYRIYC